MGNVGMAVQEQTPKLSWLQKLHKSKSPSIRRMKSSILSLVTSPMLSLNPKETNALVASFQ
jgi:hypothetical protein